MRRTRLFVSTWILLAPVCAGLAGCSGVVPYKIDRVRPGSPLGALIRSHQDDAFGDRQLREAVWRQIPIGSTRAQLEAFVSRNFVGVRYVVRTRPARSELAQPPGPHVYIRAYDRNYFGLEEEAEIYLLLDPDGRLRDVEIERAH